MNVHIPLASTETEVPTAILVRCLYVILALAGVFSPSLKASGIITCYSDSDTKLPATTKVPCMSQTSFLPFSNDFLDWDAAFPSPGNTYDPATHGGASWAATSYYAEVSVGLAAGPGMTGSTLMQRTDNTGIDSKGKSYPVPLVGFENNINGSLELQFSHPISMVGFDLGTLTGFGVDAVIKAYLTPLPPTSSDIPVISYRLTDTADGGTALTVPWNTATPFLALNSPGRTFNYITISATDATGAYTGFYISDLYLNTTDTPEPMPAFLIGGGCLLIGLASRKLRALSRNAPFRA